MSRRARSSFRRRGGDRVSRRSVALETEAHVDFLCWLVRLGWRS